MAIKPGQADETCELLGTVLIMKRGVRTEAWCLACWLPRFTGAVVEPPENTMVARHFQPKALVDA